MHLMHVHLSFVFNDNTVPNQYMKLMLSKARKAFDRTYFPKILLVNIKKS